MIKHILFDCDGVLVDTEITAAHIMVNALQQKGVSISVEHYLQHLSGTTFTNILQAYLPHHFTHHQQEQFIRNLEEQIVAQVKPIAGVDAMLSAISLPKSIVSNSHIWQVQAEIEHTGLSSHFTGFIFSSEQVKKPKPAPDVYLLALKSLGLSPEEVLVVEDSIAGAKAALAAQIATVGFSGASHILEGHAEALKALGIHYVANDMDALGEVLKNLSSK